jgi:hypothetical protein
MILKTLIQTNQKREMIQVNKLREVIGNITTDTIESTGSLWNSLKTDVPMIFNH